MVFVEMFLVISRTFENWSRDPLSLLQMSAAASPSTLSVDWIGQRIECSVHILT
jgi:hypothetical protein